MSVLLLKVYVINGISLDSQYKNEKVIISTVVSSFCNFWGRGRGYWHLNDNISFFNWRCIKHASFKKINMFSFTWNYFCSLFIINWHLSKFISFQEKRLLHYELKRLEDSWKEKQVNIFSPSDIYIKMSIVDVDWIIVNNLFQSVISPKTLFLMSKGTKLGTKHFYVKGIRNFNFKKGLYPFPRGNNYWYNEIAKHKILKIFLRTNVQNFNLSWPPLHGLNINDMA